MATRIKLKRSTTAATVPTTSNLEDGEVAVNIADRKIYVRNGASVVEVANQVPSTGTISSSMLATDITNGPGQTYYVATTGSNVTTLGSGGANGKHQDTPFLTIEKALSVATSGDTVLIGAGVFQETFPLTVPDGVTVKGTNLRSTQITPTSGTNDLNAFILSGDVHISDLTVKDFFYNSSNDTGYGFVCASSLDSDRSPYLERVTVLTKGSVTSGSDPYGFAQGDAGRGAKLDGALFASAGLEAAILFNEVTFIVPNSVGLYLTNGVRVEWLNSFIYFANEGIKGVQGTTGRSGTGQTRLKLSGVSGTFSSSEIIYQLEDSFKSGTYARSGTTVTVTRNDHGMSNGDVVYSDFISGSGTDNYYTIANVATNTFELTDSASGTTSGNVTYKKATAYGTVTTNDGTYILINGKGTGEFVTGVPIAKTGVVGGDAKLDTAQKKFGTASLELDGTTDNLTYPTSPDFGFGTTNWAAECFIRPTSVTGTQYIFDFRTGSATDTAPTVYLNGTALHFGVGNTSQATGGTLSTGTWYHVAVARSGGSTKLFLDGTQVGSTYTDTNNYGTTKPVAIGSDYNSAANAFAGHIDEVRISKAAARYTANFTAPTTALGNDLNTVLLIHFDGTDGSTTITDSSGGVKDIRSSGGDSATSILTADYAQFGAELRGISSANIYGTKGAIADGAGVKILLTAHNFAYVGSGADFTNDPSLAVPANEVTESNGGKIFYSATNQNGDFRVGDAFVVDQATGNVQFQSTSTSQEAANITLSDATGTTKIFPAFVETGNLRLGGNTISSTSGSVIVDPSANEDILLNAETIVPETLYFSSNKIVGIGSPQTGNLSYTVDGNEQAGFSSYGLYTNKNLTVYSLGIDTVAAGAVTIVNEGSDYAASGLAYQVVSNPTNQATATCTLAATGTIATIELSNIGELYTAAPDITIAAPGGSGQTATASVALKTNSGKVATATASSPGSGYVSPTLTFDPPSTVTFNVLTQINIATDAITLANHGFVVGNTVVYNNEGGTQNIGLTSGTTYYVVAVTTDTLKLSATSGGSVINLTAAGGTEVHSIRGTAATATVAVSSGELGAVTITSSGFGYTSNPNVTITDSGGSGGTINVNVGYSLGVVTIGASGDGYSSAPAVSFALATGDTTGTGAAGNAIVGKPIDTVTVTSGGRGYSIAPTVEVIGGQPTTPADLTPTFDKKTGVITAIAVTNAGVNFRSTPTLNIIGGEGSDAQLTLNILPFAGTISTGGSGYKAGTYTNISIVGGGVQTPATATITVVGLSGTLVGGSGYSSTGSPYLDVKVRNQATSTIAVTSASRNTFSFGYAASNAFAWDVTASGQSDYTFTRTSASGTASGDDISITAEVGDTLTFTMNAAGHPFYIQTVAAPYDSNNIVQSGVTGNGSDTGTIIWNLANVAPGTYHYVCGNHAAMTGTITVSAFSGTQFAASDTITGGTSGASGTVTFVDGGFMRLSGVTNGPFQDTETISNGSISGTISSTPSDLNVLILDGTESPATSLLSFNSYTFDVSDSSMTGQTISFGTNDPDKIVSDTNGIAAGTANAKVFLTVKSAFVVGTTTLFYGSVPGTGNNFAVTSGAASQGDYGYGGLVDIVVSEAGVITSWTWKDQGTDYKVTDVLFVDDQDVGGGGGSGMSYTISGNDTSISSVTNISTSGGPYALNDVLSVDSTFDGVGSGSGFTFTVNKVGYLDNLVVDLAGFGYYAAKDLFIVQGPTTTGTAIQLRVNTTVALTPIEVKYDGSIVSGEDASGASNWSIQKDGTTNLGTGSLTSGQISSSGGVTASGNITSSSQIGGNTLNISSSASINSLTASGVNSIDDATIKLGDGTVTAPTLQLKNSPTTGLYRAGSDDIGLTIGGTQRGSISGSGFDISTNFVVDQTLTESIPYFTIDATAETVTIGAADKQLQITNDGTIASVGTDTDVDIKFSPKGTGNLVLTGGLDQDFSITDGSVEKFKVDTDSGDTEVKGKLDISSNVRVQDNAISSDIGSVATTSFGQVISVSLANVATGYTNGSYTNVASTTNGSGTGATFDVTISGGDITACVVNAGGKGYKRGETITLATTDIGSGSGKSILVNDIEGAGLILRPSAGKNVMVDATSMFVVPAGTTNQRPGTSDRQTGGIRFNSEQQQFEGYNGNDFVSLGGVRDVDQDTYILTESAPAADEDTFEFYNQGVNSLSINKDKVTWRTAKSFDVAGTLVVDGITAGSDPLDIRRGTISISKFRDKKDFEICDGSTTALRLRAVPQQGGISTIGTVTSNGNNYATSQTYTGVAGTGNFEGGGATFNVVTNASGGIQSVAINAAGTNFEVGEVIVITGNLVGGIAGPDNLTFSVTAISSAVAEFARLDIISQDYVTRMDGKPFISLDANGAEAGFKVNRGWNGGSTSYLTMFDSTATFVELDDCRVEGGQLASFPSTASIVQFDKTAFKGAKTLVTIESDDGKVHMLEVTTVCAAAGTTAHATVTNSVTSDNDLVDATISVVGNNVTVSLAKSSAASSSSNFSGRFTTTKVKA